jgi:hypothetical protein
LGIFGLQLNFFKSSSRLFIQVPFFFVPVAHSVQIKQGIDGFRNGDYNFDDIDDCGKWRVEKLKKTFREAPGMI